MESPDGPSDKSEASRLFERAILTLQSQMASSGEKVESAFDNLKRSHELCPGDYDCMQLLLDLCFVKGVSIQEAGLTTKDIQTLYQSGASDQIIDRVEQYRYRQHQADKKSESNSVVEGIQTVIEVLEAITEIDPQPFLIRRLVLMYRSIGRMREGLELLLSVAEEDVAESGPKYILACDTSKDYEGMVRYYEKHREVLEPHLNSEKRIFIALAYERIADELTFRKCHKLDSQPAFEEGLSCLNSAEHLYDVNREEYDPENTREPYPTEDEILSLSNYGQIFAQQALHVEDGDGRLPR